MKRRTLLPAFAAAAMVLAALCLSRVEAQVPARIARIAIVLNDNETQGRPIVDAFRTGLRELGYVEGRTVDLDIRYSRGQLDRFPGLVEDVARRGAEVIVVASYPGIRAAKQTTSRIPIVGFSCGLELLVESLGRPGGNVTGVTCQSSELAAKQLQLLREALPAAKRIAVLSNPASPYNEPTVRELRSAAGTLGMQMSQISVSSPAEFQGAVARMQQAGAEAVFLVPDAMLLANRGQLLALLLANRLPVMGFFREFVEAGALLSYSANRAERYHRVAWYVDRILNGAKPAEMPVEQPTKFELVVNLNTAKALGITIPPGVLLRTDEKIE